MIEIGKNGGEKLSHILPDSHDCIYEGIKVTKAADFCPPPKKISKLEEKILTVWRFGSSGSTQIRALYQNLAGCSYFLVIGCGMAVKPIFLDHYIQH